MTLKVINLLINKNKKYGMEVELFIADYRHSPR